LKESPYGLFVNNPNRPARARRDNLQRGGEERKGPGGSYRSLIFKILLRQSTSCLRPCLRGGKKM